MPMFPPYVYLMPLQQYHTMQHKPPPPAPSPHYPSPSPPPKPLEAYQQTLAYPAPSASPQYDHHTPPAEPSFNPNPYQGVSQPPPQRMPCASLPWQQVHPPRNPGYPSPPPPYSNPPPSSQGYHPGQAAVHPLYPSAAPPYPTFAMGYQPSSAPDDLQASQEPLQVANPDPAHSLGRVRVLNPLETPPPNINRSIVVTANYGR